MSSTTVASPLPHMSTNTLCSVDMTKDALPPMLHMKFMKLGLTPDGKITPKHQGMAICDIPLPPVCEKDDRMLGQPQCIGYNGRYAVIKYITVSDQYMKFLLVDTWEQKILQVLSDLGRYFCKDILPPLDCLLQPLCSFSPSSHVTWILRLPQIVLMPFRWSRMYLYTCDLNSGHTSVTNTLRDRRWQGVAFHPQGHQLCLSLVNTYGYKCKIIKMDPVTLQVLGQRDFKSPLRLRSTEEGTIVQSVLQYSHDGDSILVVSCMTCLKGTFCLLQFDSVSLACLYCYRTTNTVSAPLTINDRVGIFILPCGSSLKLWSWDDSKGEVVASFALAKPSSLSSICRTIIRNYVLLQDIPKLPLPTRLQLFLVFSTQVPPLK